MSRRAARAWHAGAALGALALAAASAWGQAPAAKPAPQAGMVYDRYQASQRLRLRAESCMRDEDSSGAYCIKKCASGYVSLDSPPPGARICRSARPLGPGQIQPPLRKQLGVQPAPPKPSATPVPGS
jgi:hypothetical protein